MVEGFCSSREWAHYVGPLFGQARVPYFLLADVFLMPGAIGLAVLDCFALQLPMLTTTFRYHGPERAYVIDQVNGIVTKRYC